MKREIDWHDEYDLWLVKYRTCETENNSQKDEIVYIACNGLDELEIIFDERKNIDDTVRYSFILSACLLTPDEGILVKHEKSS